MALSCILRGADRLVGNPGPRVGGVVGGHGAGRQLKAVIHAVPVGVGNGRIRAETALLGIRQPVRILVGSKRNAVHEVSGGPGGADGGIGKTVGSACHHIDHGRAAVPLPGSAGADAVGENVRLHRTARPAHQAVDPEIRHIRPAPAPMEEGIADRGVGGHRDVLIKGAHIVGVELRQRVAVCPGRSQETGVPELDLSVGGRGFPAGDVGLRGDDVVVRGRFDRAVLKTAVDQTVEDCEAVRAGAVPRFHGIVHPVPVRIGQQRAGPGVLAEHLDGEGGGFRGRRFRPRGEIHHKTDRVRRRDFQGPGNRIRGIIPAT